MTQISANAPMADGYNIQFFTERSALVVLNELNAIIQNYGYALISDMYDLIGASCQSKKNTKAGWESMDDAKIIECDKGYMLHLPEPITRN